MNPGFVGDEYRALALDTSLSGNRAGMIATGYTDEQLDALPAAAVMGISCGNPTAACPLEPGMSYLDLGSGTGADVILAGLRVQPGGHAVGLDLLPEMVTRARECAASCDALRPGVARFAAQDLRDTPYDLEAAAFDHVTSNCVICLLDQPAVFAQAFRVLKPGGTLVFSEVARADPLPDDLRAAVRAAMDAGLMPPPGGTRAAKVFRIYVTLVNGQSVDETAVGGLLAAAGFQAHAVVERLRQAPPRPAATFVLGPDADAGDGGARIADRRIADRLNRLLDRHDVNDYMSLVTIRARKPPVHSSPERRRA